MPKLPLIRRLLKLFHPEGIPWPGTVVYNWASSTGMFQRHYELVAKHILGFCAQGSLLDVGTGPGWLLLKLHEQCPNMKLVGCDVSAPMVVKTRKNIAEAGFSDLIEVRDSNADQMPFADAFFDIVVSTGSIHHWKVPVKGLNEVYRVLKPGGYALMYDLVSDTPEPIFDEMRSEFGQLKMMLFWLHSFEEPFYTRESFGQLARETLFKQGQTEFVGVLCCLKMQKSQEGIGCEDQSS